METTVLTPWRRHSNRKARRVRRLPPAALLFVWTLTLIWTGIVGWGLVARLRAGEPAFVPVVLQGVWTTRYPQYVNRALEITADAIVFRSSADSAQAFPIVRVRAKREADALSGPEAVSGWYTISYGSRRQPRRVEIFYKDSRRRPRIWTKNRPNIIWTRGGV